MAIDHLSCFDEEESAGGGADTVGEADLLAGDADGFHEGFGEYADAHGLSGDAGDHADDGGEDDAPAVEEWYSSGEVVYGLEQGHGWCFRWRGIR